ncbi:TIGR03086 family protein [Mycolicibacterium cosmeticum]|uniref:Actinobacterial protein n=2 Tax=Mycolicibacterium cosmeticum TaxID=258533 RepID=W9AWS1_MYCCO|nr:TIGR03086 family protein [Mycolicibacterium cosmeticum]CDO09968.1 putative Actinobacterial protein [Mycolicibacterium cosmeticum]
MRMHTIDDLRPAHRTAVLATVPVVAAVSAEDLRRPTPCAGWDLTDLLAHMTVQHRGFAAAARGNGADAGVWDATAVRDALTRAPGDTYAAAAHDVLEAFAAPEAAQIPFALPEFGPGAVFPGAVAIGFHLIDYVVHGWDVAATLGQDYHLPTDVLEAALPLALMVPDGDYRSIPDAPFGPAHQGPAADVLDRIVAHLGRDPHWQPSRPPATH